MINDRSKLVPYSFWDVYKAVCTHKKVTLYGQPLEKGFYGMKVGCMEISYKTPATTILRLDPIEGVEAFDLNDLSDANRPYHIHDCFQCEFLGHTSEGNDVWFHHDAEKEYLRTLLIRYSSDGPDYCSVFKPQNGMITNGDGKVVPYNEACPEYEEAWQMMLAKGYMRG